MKSAFVLIVLATLAYAEVEIFANDQQINIEDKELLEKMDNIHFSVTKESSEPTISTDDLLMPIGLVENKIVAALEKAREQFGVGFPNQGIPPIDPFTHDKVSIELYHKPYLFKAKLNLLDISVTGLQKFVIEHIKFKLVGLKFELDLDIPELVYDSDFQIRGRITTVIPYSIGGGVRLKLKHFRISGQATMGTSLHGHLLLKKLSLNFTVKKTSLRFRDIIGNGPINDIVNWILNIFTDDVIKEQIEGLGHKVTEELFVVIDNALRNIKLSDLIG